MEILCWYHGNGFHHGVVVLNDRPLGGALGVVVTNERLMDFLKDALFFSGDTLTLDVQLLQSFDELTQVFLFHTRKMTYVTLNERRTCRRIC